jgi:hypothetical protein
MGAVSLEHDRPGCGGRWDQELIAGQVYVRCESCHAVHPGGSIDAEPIPEPQPDPELHFRTELALALGYQPDMEPPAWIDLVQQVRRDRTVREEIELDAWGYIATALRALEKHWPKLNPQQMWGLRDHLRSFAKRLPKIDPKDLPKRGHW